MRNSKRTINDPAHSSLMPQKINWAYAPHVAKEVVSVAWKTTLATIMGLGIAYGSQQIKDSINPDLSDVANRNTIVLSENKQASSMDGVLLARADTEKDNQETDTDNSGNDSEPKTPELEKIVIGDTGLTIVGQKTKSIGDYTMFKVDDLVFKDKRDRDKIVDLDNHNVLLYKTENLYLQNLGDDDLLKDVIKANKRYGSPNLGINQYLNLDTLTKSIQNIESTIPERQTDFTGLEVIDHTTPKVETETVETETKVDETIVVPPKKKQSDSDNIFEELLGDEDEKEEITSIHPADASDEFDAMDKEDKPPRPIHPEEELLKNYDLSDKKYEESKAANDLELKLKDMRAYLTLRDTPEHQIEALIDLDRHDPNDSDLINEAKNSIIQKHIIDEYNLMNKTENEEEKANHLNNLKSRISVLRQLENTEINQYLLDNGIDYNNIIKTTPDVVEEEIDMDDAFASADETIVDSETQTEETITEVESTEVVSETTDTSTEDIAEIESTELTSETSDTSTENITDLESTEIANENNTSIENKIEVESVGTTNDIKTAEVTEEIKVKQQIDIPAYNPPNIDTSYVDLDNGPMTVEDIRHYLEDEFKESTWQYPTDDKQSITQDDQTISSETNNIINSETNSIITQAIITPDYSDKDAEIARLDAENKELRANSKEVKEHYAKLDEQAKLKPNKPVKRLSLIYKVFEDLFGWGKSDVEEESIVKVKETPKYSTKVVSKTSTAAATVKKTSTAIDTTLTIKKALDSDTIVSLEEIALSGKENISYHFGTYAPETWEGKSHSMDKTLEIVEKDGQSYFKKFDVFFRNDDSKTFAADEGQVYLFISEDGKLKAHKLDSELYHGDTADYKYTRLNDLVKVGDWAQLRMINKEGDIIGKSPKINSKDYGLKTKTATVPSEETVTDKIPATVTDTSTENTVIPTTPVIVSNDIQTNIPNFSTNTMFTNSDLTNTYVTSPSNFLTNTILSNFDLSTNYLTNTTFTNTDLTNTYTINTSNFLTNTNLSNFNLTNTPNFSTNTFLSNNAGTNTIIESGTSIDATVETESSSDKSTPDTPEKLLAYFKSREAIDKQILDNQKEFNRALKENFDNLAEVIKQYHELETPNQVNSSEDKAYKLKLLENMEQILEQNQEKMKLMDDYFKQQSAQNNYTPDIAETSETTSVDETYTDNTTQSEKISEAYTETDSETSTDQSASDLENIAQEETTSEANDLNNNTVEDNAYNTTETSDDLTTMPVSEGNTGDVVMKFYNIMQNMKADEREIARQNFKTDNKLDVDDNGYNIDAVMIKLDKPENI